MVEQGLQKAGTNAVEVRRDAAIKAATAGAIQDVSKLRDIFEQTKAVAFVLAPSLQVSALPPMTAVHMNVVFIDTDAKSGDVYQDRQFCDGDEVALNKPALMRIMAAAGISPVMSKGERVMENVWKHSIILRGRGLDGLYRDYPASKEIDLREGAPDAMKKGREHLDPSALANARRHAPRNAEAKAINAALRGFLGVKQKYKKSDLQSKPFVVPVLVPNLDLNDPDQKRAAIHMALGAGAALYDTTGPQQLLAAGADPSPEPSEPSDPPQASSRTSGPNPPPPADDPDPDDDTLANAGGPRDDEDAMPGDPEPTPTRHVCGCVCGDQSEITASFAGKTKDKLGIALCAACIPGAKFYINGHRQFARLTFPVRKDLEPIEAAIAEAVKRGAVQ